MIDKNMISVIGSGTMGNGIAHVFALSKKVGNVYLVDLDIDILEKAKFLIERNLQRQVQKNIISDFTLNAPYSQGSLINKDLFSISWILL